MHGSRSVSPTFLPGISARLDFRQHEQLSSMDLIHDTSRSDTGQGAAGSMDSSSAILAKGIDIKSFRLRIIQT